jgi:hypothetical protein
MYSVVELPFCFVFVFVRSFFFASHRLFYLSALGPIKTYYVCCILHLFKMATFIPLMHSRELYMGPALTLKTLHFAHRV